MDEDESRVKADPEPEKETNGDEAPRPPIKRQKHMEQKELPKDASPLDVDPSKYSVQGDGASTAMTDSKQIMGSLFRVAVTHPPQLLGKNIRIIPACHNCNRIAVRNNSELFVTTWTKHRVHIYEKDGKSITDFGGKGRDNGKFVNANGVAIGDSGCISVVADWGNHRVQKFSKDLKFMAEAGGKGSENGHPTGMTFSPQGELYVCDFKNNRVQVLDKEMKFVRCLRTEYLSEPEDVALDSSGDVYVTDGQNNRIAVFSPEGSYKREFGSLGTEQGQLNFPLGICIDRNDYVYVTERSNNRVSVFRTSGEFITSFGEWGSKEGYFKEPLGIAVDEDGFVYVCDSLNHRIQVF